MYARPQPTFNISYSITKFCLVFLYTLSTNLWRLSELGTFQFSPVYPNERQLCWCRFCRTRHKYTFSSPAKMIVPMVITMYKNSVLVFGNELYPVVSLCSPYLLQALTVFVCATSLSVRELNL